MRRRPPPSLKVYVAHRPTRPWTHKKRQKDKPRPSPHIDHPEQLDLPLPHGADDDPEG